ncbi:MAG: alpha/beta fold hydrolase [Chloroflexota bacterium]
MKNKPLPHIPLSLAILVLVLSACSQFATSKKPGEGISLKPCDLQGIQAECGKLPVYENRADTAGRVIEINVAVVRAKSKPAQPDPLFFFTGGPGGAGTQMAQLAVRMFAEVNQQRDIILFDQRGTGESNKLICLEIDEDGKPEAYIDRCLADLPGDPRFYTTTIAMQDVDEIRQALGYEAINVYSISYGATAVQVYMNLFPGRVRSAVLDPARCCKFLSAT